MKEKMTEEDAVGYDTGKKYSCHICSESVIRYGDNFCPCCGTPLVWDDEIEA